MDPAEIIVLLQAQDLPPLEESRLISDVLQATRMSQRELAPQIRRNQSHISKQLKLLADLRTWGV